MTTYISPNKTMRVTDEVSGGHSVEMTIPSNARIRNKEIQEVLKDCLIFKRSQENIAMSVLSSFWWMFNESWENDENAAEYGSSEYLFAFVYRWELFLNDLSDKNEELYSILFELTDEQIKEIAGA